MYLSKENALSAPIELTATNKALVVEDLAKNQYAIFSEEIQRLCNIEKSLFNEVLKLPHLFDNEKSASDSSKSKDYFIEGIKHIENELQKLEKMEVVIAFVGTMKAGKSTTINAIVGTEILPNRNTPMTTLPTLIRNKHGQAEPVLRFNKLKPLEDLSRQIAIKLKSLVQANATGYIDLYKSEAKELIDYLLKNKGYDFKDEYQGQQEIFLFLKHLNDLMRLANEVLISIKPPYHEYENLNDLPVIEIEFFHLKGKANTAQGSLAILDTPGPNEFGQSEALCKVFKTQLEKASAVGLIIDYTQIKSNAEEHVRNELHEVTKQLSKNNLYLFINKFDQLNSNSMKEDELKAFVVNTLMRKEIEQSQVYPISAQKAYLANRAKYNLNIYGKLPNFEQEEWVNDFGSLAMSTLWEDFRDNKEVVEKSANALWKQSRFNEPLKGMIETAHDTAAEKTVKSAIIKLVEWHRELTNTCSIFNTSITIDINKITEAINSLETNINEFEEVRKNVVNTATKNLGELSEELNKLISKHCQRIEEDIKILFDDGKVLEEVQSENNREQLKKLHLAQKDSSFRDYAASILSLGTVDRKKTRKENITKKHNKDFDFDKNNPIISFDNQLEAQNLSKSIQNAIVNIFENLSSEFSEKSSSLISKMAGDISKDINKAASDTLNKAKEKLGDSGFQLDLFLPTLNLASKEFDRNNLLVDGLTSKTKNTTRYKRTDGVWGTICGWFDTNDWGWDEITVVKQIYQVDTTIIRNNVTSQINAYKKDHTTQFQDYLKREFEPTIEEHINGLTNYLARYRDLLINSMATNRLAQDDKKKLSHKMSLLMTNNKKQANDIKVIESNLG